MRRSLTQGFSVPGRTPYFLGLEAFAQMGRHQRWPASLMLLLFFPDSFSAGEPRVLGLAMVPGHHIVSIEVQRESLAGPPYL